MRQIILTIIIFVCVSYCLANSADDYLVFEAKINGQPVVLAFDTGAEGSMLFRRTAERLKLTVVDPPKAMKESLPPGKVKTGYTELCRLSNLNLGIEMDVRFRVFDVPAEAGAYPLDGVIGWPNFKDNILQIDRDSKKIKGLDKLPVDIEKWSKWAIYNDPGFQVLLIKVPDATGQEGVICIDTGAPGGVSLSAGRWKDWCDKNEGHSLTVTAYYSPAVGLKVYEERWADNLSIGDFVISGVPVTQGALVLEQAIPQLQATVGLFALSRLEVIVDGPGGCFYTRQRKNPQLKYSHNRAAAVFVPKDFASPHLVAHVVDNGPAFQAGIRNGDILLKIDDLDVTKWQTDPKVLPLSRFWERPAGTKMQLSLMRNDKLFSAVIELRDILGN